MLSPPRLPVLCIAFHADACVTSQRASTGLTQAQRSNLDQADLCKHVHFDAEAKSHLKGG